MATNNINPNADPGIPVVNNAPLDPSLVASTATVNTKVDPLLNTTQTLIVTTAANTSPSITSTNNATTLTQINIINQAVQNFLDTYQGNIGNVYHANVAEFAKSVPYTGITGRPDFSLVATTGSFNDLKDLPPQFNFTGIATETFVSNAISNVVGYAPNALNTLGELAAAIGNNANYSTTITNLLANKANVSSIPNLSPYATTVYVDNKTTYANITGKPTIPTRTSNLINDNAFITMANLSSYALTANLPTRTSNLYNDSGFITAGNLNPYALVSSIPTRLSTLTNDVGYITGAALNSYALNANIPTRLSNLTNDIGYITSGSLGHYSFFNDTIQNDNGNSITLNTGPDSWVFNTNGNLTLPRNTSAVNYANGKSIIPTPVADSTTNSDIGVMMYDGTTTKYSSRTTVNPVTGDIKTPGNIVIRGNLSVLGTLSQLQLSVLNISNHEIRLNYGMSGAPVFDANIIVDRGSSPNAALRWNESIQKWQQTRDGSTYIDIPISTTELTEGTNLYYTDSRANTSFDNRLSSKSTTNLAEGTNLYYTDGRANVAFDNRLTSKTTSNLSEGTNLYFTNTRARTAISVTGSGSYNANTGVITVTGGVTSVNSKTGAVTLTTTDINEGANLYYTDARANTAFDNRLSTKTTDDLTEGANLYYTDDRANTAFDNRLVDKTTDDLTEGVNNFYYTNDKANTSIYNIIPSYAGNLSANNANFSNLVTGTFKTNNANLGNLATANYITISSNVTSGNANLGNLAIANYVTISANLVTGNANLGNIVIANNLSVTSTLSVSNVTVSGKINGNLVPSDDIIYDLGSSTNRWRDLYLSGSTIKLGTQTISSNLSGISTGNLTASNVVTTGAITTTGNISGASITASGNISGANIISSGDLTVTGNISGATVATTGNISGTNIIGSGSISGSSITVTGNTNSGNIISSGNINGLSISVTGTVIAGGNISGASISASGGITASGNISGSNFITIGNITAGNVSTSGTVVASGTITGATVTSTGSMNATGNVSGGNITTTGTISGAVLSVTGNIISTNANLGNATISSYFIGNGYLLNNINAANITGQISNALIAGTVYTNAQPNITSVGTLTSLAVTGNISSGNANLGNLTISNYFKGDGSLLTSVTGGNVTGSVNNATLAVTATYANTANSVTWTNITSKPTTVGGYGITDAYSNANVQNWLTLNPQGSTYGNSNVATYLPTFTGNIKSGNANLGNTVVANYFNGDGSLLTNINGSNVTGTVSAATTAGTATYAGTANSVSWNRVTGTPTTVSGYGITDAYGNNNVQAYLLANPQPGTYGNSSVANYLPTYAGVINASSANLGNLITANYHQGILTTGTQPNITSVGTLTSLVMGANANITMIGTQSQLSGANLVNANYHKGDGSLLSSITGANVSGQVGNALIAGTVYTGPQPNITGLGTLSNLSIVSNGNIAMSGVYSFISGAYSISGTYLTGTLTTGAQPNVTSVGTLSSLSVTANANVGNINSTGLASITGNVSGGNINTSGLVSATGNVSGGNLNTGGVVVATGNVSGGNLNASGVVSATGNIYGGNLYTPNLIYTSSTLNATGSGTGALRVDGGASIAKDLFVGGTLYSANIAFVNSTTLNANSALLYLQASPTYPYNYETGFYSHFQTSAGNGASNGYQHTGFVRNHNDNYWYLFSNIATEPAAGLVDLTNSNIVYDNIKLGSILSTGNANISGNITAANANLGNIVVANYHKGDGSLLTNINGSNVTGTVGNATVAGTVTTAAQPNITSVGTLTSLTVTTNGNIAMGGSSSQITGVNSISSTYFVGNGAFLTGLPAGYANSNVASYLPTYAGNISSGNISYTGQLISTVSTGTSPLTVTSTTRVNNLNVSYANVSDYGVVTAQTTGTFYPVFVSNTTTGNYALASSANISYNIATGTVNAISFVSNSGNISGANLVSANYVSISNNINLAYTTTSVANLGNIVTANYILGNGAFLTGLPAGYANSNVASYLPTYTGNLTAGNIIGVYANGNSNINIPNANGNVNISAAGNANVLVVTGTGVNIAGTLSTGTGNITGGNVIATLVGSHANGTSNVNIASSNGNITMAVNGTANVVTITGTGINVAGTLNATGNIIGVNASLGNTVTANYFTGVLTTAAQPNITSVGTLTSLAVTGNTTTGNLTGANLVSANYITGNLIPIANGNITLSGSLSQLSGANLVSASYITGTLTTASQPNITSLGTLLTVTHAANANIVMSGSQSNISGANLVSANYVSGTLTTAAQPNITSVGTLTSLAVTGNTTTGNLTGANLVSANYITGTLTTAAQPNITSLGTITSLTVTGNTTTGNLTGANLVSANYFTGTLTTASQPNITSLGTLTSLSVTGLVTSGNVSTGNVNANYFVGNGAFLSGLPASYANSNVANYLPTYTGNIASGNINVSGQIISNIATGTAPITVISTTRVSNLNVDRANVSDYSNVSLQSTGIFYPVFASSSANGSYTLGANANLSFNAATGALTANTITSASGIGGTITGANSIVANYFIGSNYLFNPNGSMSLSGPLSQITGANLVSASYVTLLANGNVTMSGSLSQISGANLVSAINLSGNLTTVANGNITMSGTQSRLSGANLVSANYFTGVLTTSAQPNVTSVGTLSSLSVTGNVSAGNFVGANLVSASYHSGDGSLLTNLNSGSITGQVANALIAGTVYTAAQTNITSVGTLTGLKVGNVSDYAQLGNSTITLTSAGTISGGNLVSATYLTGTLTTASQPSITSVGTLTGLTVINNGTVTLSGPTSQLSGANLVSANYFVGNGSLLTGLPASYTNTNASAYLSSGSFTGTANVGNLVSQGTISATGNLTVGSWLTEQQTTEVLTNMGTVSTQSITCNLSMGATFYVPTASYAVGTDTINFTNVPTTMDRTIVATVIVYQSGGGFIRPTTIQIDGVGSPTVPAIKWIGGSVPTATGGGVDVFTFALIRTGGAWAQILGSGSGFQ